MAHLNSINAGADAAGAATAYNVSICSGCFRINTATNKCTCDNFDLTPPEVPANDSSAIEQLSDAIHAICDQSGSDADEFAKWLADGGMFELLESSNKALRLEKELKAARNQNAELLEALRDMVSDHACLSDATLQFARATIAKATGSMTMNLTTMPRVGEIIDGLTVGALMIDQQTGQPYALMVSPASTDDDLKWDDANEWAASLGDGFRLPDRPEGAALYANNRMLGMAVFEPEMHWLNEQSASHLAWYQVFHDGGQEIGHKVSECRARAVRRVDIVLQEVG